MKHLIFICLLLLPVVAQAQSPTADAGADRTALVNETIALDGTASTNAFDGLQTDGRHSIRWDFGYGGWTYEGGLTAPIAYPTTGAFTVTLTVCNSGGTCTSDTATVTVSAITEGTETVVGDTGNVITNGTNLCAALTTVAGNNNPVITITAGVTYDMDGQACELPNRTGSGYVTIRTSAHASLPNGTTRVFPADATNMAIITPGDHAGNPAINSAAAAFHATAQTNPAHHYRFLGIHFKKKFPTLDYSNPRAFLDIGDGSPTAIAQLPHHFIIDRCFIDGGNTTAATARGVALQVTDSAVVNSYIYRVQGVGIEVQTIWIGMGERIAVLNNYLSATTENMMSGGNDVTIRLTEGTAQATGNDSTHIKLAASESAVDDFYTGKGIYINSGTGAIPAQYGRVITDYVGSTRIATISPAFTVTPDNTSVYRIGDHVPTDVVVRRNHFKKDLGWLSTDPSYYGTNMSVKNIFEVKQGQRYSIQGNRFETHWQEDQNWAITLTVKNQDGRQPWSKISYLDFAHNKVIDVGNGFQILASDYGNYSLGTDHMLIRHNVVSGLSTYDTSGFENFATITDGGTFSTPGYGGDKVTFVRNSTDQEGFDGKGRFLAFEDSFKFTNLTVYGNIAQGYFSGNGTTGTTALTAATGGGAGSYSVTKNGFYLATGTNPADNTTVTNRSDVLYTNITTHDLSLQVTSPFLTTGPAGSRAGADVTAVNTLTSGTVTGVWTDNLGGSDTKGAVIGRGKVIYK
jgi:hypothetical protein